MNLNAVGCSTCRAGQPAGRTIPLSRCNILQFEHEGAFWCRHGSTAAWHVLGGEAGYVTGGHQMTAFAAHRPSGTKWAHTRSRLDNKLSLRCSGLQMSRLVYFTFAQKIGLRTECLDDSSGTSRGLSLAQKTHCDVCGQYLRKYSSGDVICEVGWTTRAYRAARRLGLGMKGAGANTPVSRDLQTRRGPIPD